MIKMRELKSNYGPFPKKTWALPNVHKMTKQKTKKFSHKKMQDGVT